MSGLLEQLQAVTSSLHCVVGDQLALYRLRVWHAAKLILDNPSLLPFDRGDFEGEMVAPAEEGERLAAELNGGGESIHIAETPFHEIDPRANDANESIGPFWNASNSLVRFDIYRTQQARWISFVRRALPLPSRDLQLILPAATRLAPDRLSLRIPRGTVWISAALLAPGGNGFVGIKAKNALLSLRTALAPAPNDGRWQVASNAQWTLKLSPEQPSGNQAKDVSVKLPKTLEITNDGIVTVVGHAVIKTAQSNIKLSPGPGAVTPATGDAGILLPLQANGAPLQMDGFSSNFIHWSGKQKILSAAWLLPYAVPDYAIGDAQSGGFVELILGDGATTASVVGTQATMHWSSARLRLSASSCGCFVLPAEGLGSIDVSMWTGASSQFRMAAGGKLVSITWTPQGGAALAVGPGEVTTRWDLPRAADGKALQMPQANRAMITLSRLPRGKWLTTLQADLLEMAPSLPLQGLALRNLYTRIFGPRQLRAGGRGKRKLAIDDGFARLSFDARHMEPMLEDPYAANWDSERSDARYRAAIDILLGWTACAKPSVRAQLAAQLPWPRLLERDDDPRRDHGPPAADQNFWDYVGRRGLDPNTSLKLIDLSSNAQQFGIAIEKDGLRDARLDQSSLLSLPMANVRLFLQPQVHWEQVLNRSPTPAERVIKSPSQGLPTFAGAMDEQHVIALPQVVAARVVETAASGDKAAILFSLPFGLRAFAGLAPETRRDRPRPARAFLHQPEFESRISAATQIRLEAVESAELGQEPEGDAKMMAGMMHAVDPLLGPGVLPPEIRGFIDQEFGFGIPLHRADVSGYGLSCFSRWRRNPAPDQDFRGVSQCRFDVTVGRTSYEVIEVRSYLVCPQCRVVRTIILDRANSGVVERFDGGWKAMDDGTFDRYVQFEKGLISRFSNIRNIQILENQGIEDGAWKWQKVAYDAEAHLGLPPHETVVPVRGHVGYIPIAPVTGYVPLDPDEDPGATASDKLTWQVLASLFKKVGVPIGGFADAHLKLGQTLPLHLTGIFADRAPNGAQDEFVVAAYGAPSLPAAGEWNSVRINSQGDVSVVDPHRGLPVIKRRDQAVYRFREPSAAFEAGDDFGFLMVTNGARLLFPKPEIDPASAGRIQTDAPELADAYALSAATGLMPPSSRRLRCNELAKFALSDANEWKLLGTNFTLNPPEKSLAGAAKWQLERIFKPTGLGLGITLDSAAQSLPWKLERAAPDNLELSLPGLPVPLLKLIGQFACEHGQSVCAKKPEVEFGPAFDDLMSIINALKEFTNLPLPFDIEVRAVPGSTPAFDVLVRLRFRIPGKANERIDIGVGKFSGQFEIRGQLRAAIGAPASGQLVLAFEGDVQQSIIPPVLFAGGFFRFAIIISESEDPRIELALATTASIGGDLIKGLIELEVTVRYGYSLIPETLEPGVLLGLEARAKLLSGLLGLSFRTDALARIKRINPDDRNVLIFVQLRVIATIEVAWGLADEEEELETQFQQELPLAPLAVALGGAHPLLLATELL